MNLFKENPVNNPLFREVLKPAFYLFMFALTGTLILAGIHAATQQRIIANERAALLTQVNTLIPAERYDNDPLQDQVTVPGAALNSAAPVTVYRARYQQQPVATVVVTTTPNGYSGKIRMVIGVNADQTIAGVRVVAHQETPGLGDRIERAKDDWILTFTGKSLQDPALSGWAVQKDNGQFDQLTGATITARAVVNAVKDTLLWVQQDQGQIYQQAATVDNEINNHE